MMNRRSENGHRHGPDLLNNNEPPVSLKAINWGRLFRYLLPYRGRMALAIVALLASSGFGLQALSPVIAL